MKLSRNGAAWLGLALSLACAALPAQAQDDSKQLSCDNGNYGDRNARHCEMREQTVASIGRLNVDAGRNGGVSVKGWTRGDVLVRARVDAAAETEGAAALMASKVWIDASGGQVRANGPESANNSWWSVSYEVFVPQATDLTLAAHNGGLSISDVRGQIRFETTNGGVRLRRVAGDVSGSTTNGGVQVELAGSTYDGRQLDVTTRNGGVQVSMPASYSARLQAETTNGGIQSDFPVTVTGDLRERPRKLEWSVGAGGPLIRVATTNGQVRFKHADAR